MFTCMLHLAADCICARAWESYQYQHTYLHQPPVAVAAVPRGDALADDPAPGVLAHVHHLGPSVGLRRWQSKCSLLQAAQREHHWHAHLFDKRTMQEHLLLVGSCVQEGSRSSCAAGQCARLQPAG